ncbi:unnamed protein product [Arabidopsis arenosa]|uniref:Small EDRK-rich factor-like N-terminal domain-containing protein n=1 Tax=Arabidopsis arenosa TaxID=38785 RepID=A0A8S1ZX30_ARAAE|nr:unnamed protein product [Arabidopsis arenosa]
MAKFIVIFIVFSFLFATQFSNAKELENPSGPIHKEGGEGSLTIGQCPAACNVRCSATSHKKPCLFYCNYCCNKCLCVPSGTQRERDRERALARTGGKGKTKDDGLTPEQRRERDAKALQEKAAKKAAAAASSGGGKGNNK